MRVALPLAALLLSLAGLPATAQTLGAGLDHTCAVTSAGGVTCWGANAYGQLGTGSTSTTPQPPSAVTGLSGVTRVEAGSGHTCALTSGGTLYCWGQNGSGQLGNGTNTDRSSPTAVPGLTGVTAFAVGAVHTCAIASGTTYCWGGNNFGQIGNNTTTPRNTPIAVAGLSGATSLAAGLGHTCAVEFSGFPNQRASVRCWGKNDAGQLGNGTTTNSSTPVAVTGMTVSTAGEALQSLSAGGDHTCATKSVPLINGVGYETRCWGNNTSGQLGDGTLTNRSAPVIASGGGGSQIAVGNSHTCVRTSSGGARCWGENSRGEVGDGSQTDRPTPTLVVGLASGVAEVATGINHSCARLSTGAVWCWGRNDTGQVAAGQPGAITQPYRVLGAGEAVDAASAPEAGGLALALWPSVAAGSDAQAVVRLAAPAALRLAVFDALGRRVHAAEGSAGAGEARLAVPSAGWPAGLYVVRVEAGGAAATARLAVAR